MSRNTFLLLALGLLASAPSARAQQGQPIYEPKQAFAEADKNGDGRIDMEEFQQRMMEVFYFADANKDTYLSPEEVQHGLAFPETLGDADRNHDGKISFQEFMTNRLHAFEAADTDHDGTLSLDEVTAAFEKAAR